MKRILVCLCLVLAVLCGRPAGVAGAEVVSAEYRLPAGVDPAIAVGVTTEIWARLYRPKALRDAPYPLIVFLHGNHATCGRFDRALGIRIDDDITYTFTGTCPKGYEVVPNHLGYGYLAERLAASGYIVVSINANRGINGAPGVPGDFGLNLRRGRLVLKHLELLSRWNRRGGAPASLGFNLRGKLDLAQIGLMGHSRGGEGMRAALAQLTDRGSPWPRRIGGKVAIRAIYEIAPTDGQTSRVLNAPGVAWNVLLPYCDGDVFDLQGVQVFDRMLRERKETPRLPKSTFAVYGANHNFYNTEWQESDSFGCARHEALFPQLKGSPRQRATALNSLVPFFRAHVGRRAVPARAALFDPLVPLPDNLARITSIDRGYTDTPDVAIERRLDDFEKPTGVSSHGQAHLTRGITLAHVTPPEHASVQRAAAITWSGKGRHVFQTHWTAPGAGRPLNAFQTLEFRVARQCSRFCDAPAPLNRRAETDFSIRLVTADGQLSRPVRLGTYHDLRGPVGIGVEEFALLHPILATARIPLGAFGLRRGTPIRGVRFVFDRTESGAIYLANIRFSKEGAPRRSAAEPLLAATAGDATAAETAGSASGDAAVQGLDASILAIRRAAPDRRVGPASAPVADAVEIEIGTAGRFPVTGALPSLTIGGERFTLSRFGDGRTDRLVFTLPESAFARLPDGAAAELRLGAARSLPLGRLDKSLLR